MTEDDHVVVDGVDSDGSLVMDLIAAMSNAAKELGMSYFRPTSMSVALMAQELIDAGWPARRPGDTVTQWSEGRGDPLMTYSRPVLRSLSRTCASNHHQACSEPCGCRCHPERNRYEANKA